MLDRISQAVTKLSDFVDSHSEFVEAFTVSASFVAACGAFIVSLLFLCIQRPLARAFAMDKFAEGVNMMVIFIFAYAYYMDMFVKMPLLVASSLRMVGVAATMASTIYLSRQIYRIIKHGQ